MVPTLGHSTVPIQENHGGGQKFPELESFILLPVCACRTARCRREREGSLSRWRLRGVAASDLKSLALLKMDFRTVDDRPLSSWNIRHKQPVGHALLEVPDH